MLSLRRVELRNSGDGCDVARRQPKSWPSLCESISKIKQTSWKWPSGMDCFPLFFLFGAFELAGAEMGQAALTFPYPVRGIRIRCHSGEETALPPCTRIIRITGQLHRVPWLRPLRSRSFFEALARSACFGLFQSQRSHLFLYLLTLTLFQSKEKK